MVDASRLMSTSFCVVEFISWAQLHHRALKQEMCSIEDKIIPYVTVLIVLIFKYINKFPEFLSQQDHPFPAGAIWSSLTGGELFHNRLIRFILHLIHGHVSQRNQNMCHSHMNDLPWISDLGHFKVTLFHFLLQLCLNCTP